MPQDPIHLDPGIQPVMTGGTEGMKKDKGYGLLWMLAAEVVLLIFFLAIAPRLNAEGLLYRSAVPVTPEEVLSKDAVPYTPLTPTTTKIMVESFGPTV